jgi:anti-anti-sigma factor
VGTTFEIEEIEGEPAPGLRLRGELDIDVVERFDAAVRSFTQRQPGSLLLDVTDLRFLSSNGLSSFLHARSLVGQVVLRGCRSSVRQTFEMTGLDTFFTFTD